MRILIVDPYYPAFLDSFYRARPELARLAYVEQWTELMRCAFGTADFYSSNLRQLGIEAHEVIPNNMALQERWLVEKDLASRVKGEPRSSERLAEILFHQVLDFRPDVVHFQDAINIQPNLLREIRKSVALLTTQIACPYPASLDLTPFDLVLSSMPHFVRRFRSSGIRAEEFRLGFEPDLLRRVPHRARAGVAFVGGVSSEHSSRIALLEDLAELNLVDWWGYGIECLEVHSPLRTRYRGEAWGLSMYEILAGCQVALNCHIDVAGEHANNMRLYEATGMGALLVTDWKSDLDRYFALGTEALAYRNPAECGELIRQALADSAQSSRAAALGQRRTLRENTYFHRMREYSALVTELLDGSSTRSSIQR